MGEYDIVIGLEVHSELKTKTKAFCSCANEFGKGSNTNTCPVCIGLPGALPVLNKEAVAYTVKAGLSTDCTINNQSVFERKNYFYPDLSKAYQISQLEKPLCEHGVVEIHVGDTTKKIRINRIHLEEDAGKLIHDEFGGGSLVDYNRGGVPLIEIVSEPDLSSAEEAVAYVETLRNILVYINVSDGKMQEGSLRCDVNLSVKKKNAEKLGTRTEMKNLNSFKAIFRAIKYEQARQIEVIENGGTIIQETRRWDDNLGKSFSMRSKEDSQDYRYFPDPDLIPIFVSDEYIEKIKQDIPMLPKQREEKYITQYGLPKYDASLLVTDIKIATFFEESLKLLHNPKLLSNWIMTDIMRKLKDSETDESEILISINNFTNLLKMVENNEISVTAARTVFEEIWGTGKNAVEVVEKLGLKQVSDEGEILKVCLDVLKNNEKSVTDYKAGNTRAISFLVGQVMRLSGGKLNPQMVSELLTKELNK